MAAHAAIEGAENLAKEGEKLARESLLQLVDLEDFMNKVRQDDVVAVRKALERDFALQGLGGADLVDESGHRPLHYAAAEGKIGMMKLLLEKKASVSAATETDMWTPLHFAVKFQNLAACEMLVRNGVDTKAKDTFGRTALSYAATQPIHHVVKHGDIVNDYINEVNVHLKKMYASRKALVRRPIRDESKRVAKAYQEWWREVSNHNSEHDDSVPLPPKLGHVTVHGIMKASVAKPPTVGLYVFAGEENWTVPLAGFLRFSYTHFKETPAVQIEDVYVHKSMRRNKIAAAMVTHMLISVHRGPKRISFVYAVLDHTQDWAIDFFAKMSFSVMHPHHVPKPLRKQGMVVMAMKRCELELHKIAKVLHDRRLDEEEDLSDTERERLAAEQENQRQLHEYKVWERKWEAQFAAKALERMVPLEAQALAPPELKLSELGGDEATVLRHAALEKQEAERGARPVLCENDRVPPEALQPWAEEIRSQRQLSLWAHQMRQREPRNKSKILNLTRNLRSAWMAELEREEQLLAMPEGWVSDVPANGGRPRFLHTVTRETRSKRPRLHGEALLEQGSDAEEAEEDKEREAAFTVEVVAAKKKAGAAARMADIKARREWLQDRDAILAKAQEGRWSQNLMDEHLAARFGDGTREAREISAAYRLALQQAESVKHNFKFAVEHTHKQRARPDAPPAANTATVAARNFGSPPKLRPGTASPPPAAAPPRPRPHTAAPSSPPGHPLPCAPLPSRKLGRQGPGKAVEEWVGQAQAREAAEQQADSLLDFCAPPPRPLSAPPPLSPEAHRQPAPEPRAARRPPPAARERAASPPPPLAAAPMPPATTEPAGGGDADGGEEGERPRTAASAATTVVRCSSAAGSSRCKPRADPAARPPSAESALTVPSCTWSRPPSRDRFSRPPSALPSHFSSRPPSRDSSCPLLPSRRPSPGPLDRWSRPSSGLSGVSGLSGLAGEVVEGGVWSRPGSGILLRPDRAASEGEEGRGIGGRGGGAAGRPVSAAPAPLPLPTPLLRPSTAAAVPGSKLSSLVRPSTGQPRPPRP